MKPYQKTYRKSKIHRARDCGICQERVEVSSSPTRREAKSKIREEQEYEAI